MWIDVVKLFHDYMGNGLMFILFLTSVLYLFFVEKKKPIRILFIYLPVLLLLLYFNPLFAKVMLKVLGTEIYYRILWLVPFTIVISYSGVDLYARLQGRKQGIYLVALLCLFMVSGSYIYNSPLFHKAQNRYHMPKEVVEICDTIVIPGREVMAVFPSEMLQYVRQYTPLVRMPYGREMLVDRWNFSDPLYSAMEKKRINANNLTTKARERMCHFIILPKDKKIKGQLEDYDYEIFAQFEDYVIYKDNRVVLEIP